MSDIKQDIDRLISAALVEDLGDAGDITSETFIAPDHLSTGQIVAREDAVVSGITLVEEVFRRIDPDLTGKVIHPDGSEVTSGMSVFEVRGNTRSILTGERTALNFLQRLSGVATVTREFVRQVEGTGVRLLDTRKTTPGWRLLEKEAVRHGGGQNHRMGLFDAVMIKDNHLVANPDPEKLTDQINHLRAAHPGISVIIEADDLSQVSDFLEMAGVDRILLDNMSPDKMAKAVKMRNDKNPDISLEASGGVSLSTVRKIAGSGVDFISVGALTHSVRAVDFGLDLQDAQS